MDLSMMTGLELLTAVSEGRIPAASMAALFPMVSMQVTEGNVKIIARADERHKNPFGGVHGGFAATVLDSVTGCAVHSLLPAGVRMITTDLHITMTRPVPTGVDLIAEGSTLHLSKSIATAQGMLRSEDGILLASAVATFFIK